MVIKRWGGGGGEEEEEEEEKGSFFHGDGKSWTFGGRQFLVVLTAHVAVFRFLAVLGCF